MERCLKCKSTDCIFIFRCLKSLKCIQLTKFVFFILLYLQNEREQTKNDLAKVFEDISDLRNLNVNFQDSMRGVQDKNKRLESDISTLQTDTRQMKEDSESASQEVSQMNEL